MWVIYICDEFGYEFIVGDYNGMEEMCCNECEWLLPGLEWQE